MPRAKLSLAMTPSICCLVLSKLFEETVGTVENVQGIATMVACTQDTVRHVTFGKISTMTVT